MPPCKNKNYENVGSGQWYVILDDVEPMASNNVFWGVGNQVKWS